MKKTLLAILLCCVILFTGCFYASEKVPVNTDLPKLNLTQGGLTGNILELSHEVEGFVINTRYSIGNNYNFENWRITDNKSIKMQANVIGCPEGTIMLVEHIHVDMGLKAISPQLDGITQDSMDDSYHGVMQDGFLITNNYPYENIFAIEGFSKDIIEYWGFYCGSYGTASGHSYRLTEANLISNGVYANKLTVVYDILIKYEGEQYFHTKSIIDEFLIPLKTIKN